MLSIAGLLQIGDSGSDVREGAGGQRVKNCRFLSST